MVDTEVDTACELPSAASGAGLNESAAVEGSEEAAVAEEGALTLLDLTNASAKGQ